MARTNKQWTSKDVQTLKKNASTLTTGEIAFKLGRTKNAIYNKASEEGISLKPKDK
jgi:hypothetical protein